MDPSSMNTPSDAMSMSSSHMNNSFYASDSTLLFSTAWVPNSTGTYAGTCIFLIVLAVIFRCLFAVKHTMEKRWLDQAAACRYIVVAGKESLAEKIKSDSDSTTAILTANGTEEHVRLVRRHLGDAQPWRLSVDVPRAAIATVIVGTGYLLMLAAMTMNIGYFLSILGGTFAGELAVGRYSRVEEHH